jgi:hypothetical protein
MENTKQFQVGDTVRLISLRQADGTRPTKTNWILKEPTSPKVEDTFKVIGLRSQGWVKLEGLKYIHPGYKFEKVN